MSMKVLDFPMINKYFGKRWFSKEANQPKRHALLELILKRSDLLEKVEELKDEHKKEADSEKKILIELDINNCLYSAILPDHIEKCLKILQGQKGLEKIIGDLKNKNKFWATLCELENTALFKEKGFEIELYPHLGSRTPEMRAHLDNRWTYIEVVGSFPEFKDYVGPGEPPGWRIGNILIEEAKHFKDLPSDIPAVVIIYKGTSDADEIHLKSALEGSFCYSWIENKGKTFAEGFFQRKEEATSCWEESTKVFSSVIPYDRIVQNGLIKLTGYQCLNPYLRDPKCALTPTEKEFLDDLYKSSPEQLVQ